MVGDIQPFAMRTPFTMHINIALAAVATFPHLKSKTTDIHIPLFSYTYYSLFIQFYQKTSRKI